MRIGFSFNDNFIVFGFNRENLWWEDQIHYNLIGILENEQSNAL